MDFNYYEILGVNRNATNEEIKAAFKSLAKKYHPDKHQGNKVYEEHFKKINQAFQVLSDKNRRAVYDYKLNYQFNPPVYTSSSGSYSNTHKNSYQSKKKRPFGRKKSRKSEIKLPYKTVYTLTIIGAILFITGVLVFFNIMNKGSAKVLLEQAEQFEQKKDYFSAIEKYTEALDYNDEYAIAYEKRGKLKIKIFEDYQSGLSDLNQAITHYKMPGYLLYFARGKCYAKLKDYKNSLQDFEKCTSLNQFYDSAYFYRAEIENHIFNNFEAAIKNYSKTIALNPSSAESHFGRGYCFLKGRKYWDSIVNFNTALSYIPYETDWYYFRALAYVSLNDSSKACDDLQKSIIGNNIEAQKLSLKYCKN